MSDTAEFDILHLRDADPVKKTSLVVFNSSDETDGAETPENSGEISPEVFRRFQDGDEEALAIVITSYQNRLIGFLRLFTPGREVAEETAQDAFLKLWKCRSRIHGPDKILPWLLITAKRMAQRESGRLFRRVEIAVSDETVRDLAESIQPGQRDHVQSDQAMRILLRSMNTLKPVDRDLIALRYFAGLRIREIAETLSMPMGTVGVKLRRATDRLETRLRDQGLGREDFL